MVSYYTILDAIFIALVAYGIYYNYTHKSYIKTFEYFKIFLMITFAAKLSNSTAILLQKLYITKADTYTTLILIAFVVNFLVFYFGYRSILKLTPNFINNEKIKLFLAKIFTIIEVLVISTFTLYIVMQIYLAKVYLYPTAKQTYIYPKIEKFYNSFLNDDFVNMVMGSDTGTNHKEVLFKSFKNAF
jgi:hypothetical protein